MPCWQMPCDGSQFKRKNPEIHIKTNMYQPTMGNYATETNPKQQSNASARPWNVPNHEALQKTQ